jgi:hypothetical protein
VVLYWNWNQTVDAVFFQDWVIKDTTQLVISMFGVVLLAALYEAMNSARTRLDSWLDERAKARALLRLQHQGQIQSCGCNCNLDASSSSTTQHSFKGSGTKFYYFFNVF